MAQTSLCLLSIVLFLCFTGDARAQQIGSQATPTRILPRPIPIEAAPPAPVVPTAVPPPEVSITPLPQPANPPSSPVAQQPDQATVVPQQPSVGIPAAQQPFFPPVTPLPTAIQPFFTPLPLAPGVLLSPTPPLTFTPIPTPLPTSTPTVTPTSTVTPYPTFLPAVTPTMAWPTPRPGAIFRSRYLANVLDPTLQFAPPGSGGMRGRVVDWRGVGIENFRIIATNQRGPVESLTLGDGQYTFIGLSPGTYDVTVSDSRSEPAQSIPVQAARVTTLDWIETGRVESDPTPAQSSPTSLSIPTRTVTAVASNQSGRPPTPAARPLAPETVAIRLVLTTFEQFVGSVLTGFAAVGLTAVVVFIVLRWRANE